KGEVAILHGFGGGVGERLVELDRAGLQLPVLGVLQRQVEETAFDGAQRLVVAEREPLDDQGLGLRILREGLGPSAVDVAGKLIEEEEQRHAAARRRGPVVELAGGSGARILSEALGDEAIGLGRAPEPELVARRIEIPAELFFRAEPELEDLLRALHPPSCRAGLRSSCGESSTLRR